MQSYGVFISYRHDYEFYAGRIYDHLSQKGFQPFLDIYSIPQGDYAEEIRRQVQNTPYFLCVLTEGSLDHLDEDDWLFIEIRTALESGRRILLVASPAFRFPEHLPEPIRAIAKYQFYRMDMVSFFPVMERICTRDIDRMVLCDHIHWSRFVCTENNTALYSRDYVDNHLHPLELLFGKELVDCVREGRPFTGETRIKSWRLCCHAAAMILTPNARLTDESTFDNGLFSRIIETLLRDPSFSMEIIILAPFSPPTAEAIRDEKLGNRPLEECPDMIYLAPYAALQRLVRENPVYREAYQSRSRFRFLVTEHSMNASLQWVQYKPPWSACDHIKVNLYSEGISAVAERRSMIIFRENDPENYRFFTQRYQYNRDVRRSKELIRDHHDEWMEQYKALCREFGLPE